jgi:hypothetical protein
MAWWQFGIVEAGQCKSWALGSETLWQPGTTANGYYGNEPFWQCGIVTRTMWQGDIEAVSSLDLASGGQYAAGAL